MLPRPVPRSPQAPPPRPKKWAFTAPTILTPAAAAMGRLSFPSAPFHAERSAATARSSPNGPPKPPRRRGAWRPERTPVPPKPPDVCPRPPPPRRAFPLLERSGADALAMSRRGLSVYAAPFQPRDGAAGDFPRTPTGRTAEGDNVRHRRVPFTDAEALDENAMLDQLRGSSEDEEERRALRRGGPNSHPGADKTAAENDDEDEEGTIFLPQQQQSQVGLAVGGAANGEWHDCAGGYWDLEGPRAATRRYLRRGTPLTRPTQSNEGFWGRSETSVEGGLPEDDADLWEMNSSAYAESLDEAQVEWIEEQLRAKENPEGFFF